MVVVPSKNVHINIKIKDWHTVTKNTKNIMEYIHKIRKDHSAEYRSNECINFRTLHPDRIPVIVDAHDKHAPVLKKHKFLVPADMSYAQFLYIVRKRLPEFPAEQALYIFTENGSLLTGSELMSVVYSEFKDPVDGFLYLVYTTENAFGVELL